MKRTVLLGLILLIGGAMVGCKSHQAKPDYDAELPPGASALRKITDPAQIPDYTNACSHVAYLKEAVQYSITYLNAPSSKKQFPNCGITHEQALASANAFLELLNSGKTPAEMNSILRQKFDCYISVGCDNRGTVLFTGYYTPIFDGSEARTEKFKYPLYKAPADLKKDADGNPTTKMPDRKTIEAGQIYAGNELMWMADPFLAYVVTIQGSAQLRMPDKNIIAIGYAANNGYEYKSVRAELVKDGKIGQYDGLPAMIKYFQQHPNEVAMYTARNPRYIFFQLNQDGKPRGCLNQPVTPLRSIATDKKIFPRASVTFITTKLPQRAGGQIIDNPYTGFALDQDAGGAIRAAGRCDVYMGIGDQAGELAGRAQNEGKLYYLFLKPEYVKSAPAADAGAKTAPK